MNGCSEFTALFCLFINSTYQSMDKFVEIKWQKFSLNKNSKKIIASKIYLFYIYRYTHIPKSKILSIREVDQWRGLEADRRLGSLTKWVGWWVGDVELWWAVTLRIESGRRQRDREVRVWESELERRWDREVSAWESESGRGTVERIKEYKKINKHILF